MLTSGLDRLFDRLSLLLHCAHGGSSRTVALVCLALLTHFAVCDTSRVPAIVPHVIVVCDARDINVGSFHHVTPRSLNGVLMVAAVHINEEQDEED